MENKNSVILLEFNELCPSLMQQFMQAGKLPYFQQFYQESQVYTTDAEEKPPYLEPWVQWVTVHSGIPYSEHQISYLDQGHKLVQSQIWDRLSDQGYRVWVCGSMNTRYQAPLNGYFLPDFWNTQQTTYPEELAPFFQFVSRQVQEHTNDSMPFKIQDYYRFLTFMLKHGLSTQTIVAIAQQLLKEKQTGRYRWQRATILDKLQRDVFFWYHRRFKPHFSTFFLNSTAHFQHMHWRNMEPNLFQVKPSLKEQAEYKDAILYGYQEMDKLIGDFLRFADDQTTLILCTALSQQPCLTYESTGGKHIYRPRQFEKFLDFAGIAHPYTCSPVMAEEFSIRFNHERDAQIAKKKLAALRVNQQPMMRLNQRGTEIHAGCGIFAPLSEQTTLEIEGSTVMIPFFKLFYQVTEVKSGMHHPDGMLWIHTPSLHHTVHSEKVSLVSIAPAIMEILEDSASILNRVQQLV
jgi:hypothetical protein